MPSPDEFPRALDLTMLARDLQPIARSFTGIAAVWIFGSAVRGELRFDSDVDFAVLFAPGVERRSLILGALAARLESLTAPFPVDVVDLGAQGVIFAHGVLCDGRLIHEADREQRIDFVWRTCARAFDFQPTHDLAVRGQREGLLRRLAARRAQ